MLIEYLAILVHILASSSQPLAGVDWNVNFGCLDVLSFFLGFVRESSGVTMIEVAPDVAEKTAAEAKARASSALRSFLEEKRCQPEKPSRLSLGERTRQWLEWVKSHSYDASTTAG